MKSQPASTPEAKAAHLKILLDPLPIEEVLALRRFDWHKEKSPWLKIAVAFKQAGLYSQSTILRDIAYGLHRKHLQHYLGTREAEFPARLTTRAEVEVDLSRP